MDIDDLERLNRLWQKVYPYLVAHIMEHYRGNSGAVLELGPFSGGISRELARLYPRFDITVADELPEVVSYLKQKVAAFGLSQRITVRQTDLNNLAFSGSRFDLVIFRGAFFFLGKEEGLLGEVSRVLKEGGLAFVGGGYGKGTPRKVIDEIHGESRELNERLGRRWVEVEELEELVKDSGLTDNYRIEEEGGVWLVIRK